MRVPALRPRALLLVVLLLGAACATQPDKRLLQYLNTEGFGKRYTGNSEEENYVSIGDTVQITDSYHPDELTLSQRVGIDGTILLPELGAVHVAGLTRTEIESLLMEKYSPYYDLLDIKARIGAKGKQYFIYGEVGKEGPRPFKGDLTIWEAVMQANPDRESANLGRVRLIRPDPVDPFVMILDVNSMLDSGDSTYNVHVQELDIIYVPPTMWAQFAYFVDTLLFPLKQVLGSLRQAIGFGFGGGRRGIRGANSFFGF